MTDPALPGVIEDPHTAYIAWSYALAALSLAGLAFVGWWRARHWSTRAKAALRAEAEGGEAEEKKASTP